VIKANKEEKSDRVFEGTYSLKPKNKVIREKRNIYVSLQKVGRHLFPSRSRALGLFCVTRSV
jgi:hypothetical protein